VHEAGNVVAGVQRCRRCDIAFELPFNTHGSWEVGVRVEHRSYPNGLEMNALGATQPSALPWCELSVG
jgi:hypothetical protein